MKYLWMSTAILLASSPALHADEIRNAMQGFIDENISAWANDPVLVAAIQAQNTVTATYDQAMIDEQDQLWRGFVNAPDTDIIAEVINNQAADFLRTQVAASGGAITEAFVMDAKGLNVAASEVTSDYWQGDEAKFTQTYPVGSTAVHFGDVELDASTQVVQGQVSLTISDPATGQAVGALTVGINLTALM